ncbi:hypothetical protein WJX73_007706 [Symbiochloris irregularis]|uniref:Peptidylprolyl isomerase n=1 Tax=Symbiochloris irregularis TaxID=706552 RepID=A0AAW1PIY7_9CHLO
MADTNGHIDKPRVLIANRGEIVRRVSRSCKALGLTPVVVYTEPDALSLHVLEAEVKACLGPSPRDYTNAAKLLEVAKAQQCVAVHPGYGFLSENAEFVEACEAAGLAFLGPTSATMNMFSRKHTAREFAQSANVPVLPGSSIVTSEEEAVKEAQSTGFPVLLKATGGGGGIGIYICQDAAEVRKQFAAAGRQGKASFGDAGVFVEKYVQRAHHIEVQIFGDGQGTVVTLGERECSIQRRHQKLVEESPSPYADDAFRKDITSAARRLGEAARYRSAGTVEFLVDEDTNKFYFLEVNTRLQVEHGITELVTRTDLVDWMLQLGVPGLQKPDLKAYRHEPKGWAIEVRLNAEDPFKNFTPAAGLISQVAWPDASTGVRVDTWVESGTEVTPFYDSLLAKLMVFGSTRAEAVKKLQAALSSTAISGIPTNLEYHRAIAASDNFAAGNTTTKFLESLPFAPQAVEVLAPGMNTTVQDWPGRQGLWKVGVPPSGPMDALSLRLGNALLGNDSHAAGLEITLAGPRLRFHTPATVAVTGAAFPVTLNDSPQPMWTSFAVSRGDELAIGNADSDSCGARCYLAVSGGINTPLYLGSRSTFPGGKLGGVQGRALRPGDQLPLSHGSSAARPGLSVPSAWRPRFPEKGNAWEVGVLPGPNGAPDYFTEEDIETLHTATYTVHYNSNRLGVRLQGPRPKFARADGGGGGSHPSNVHDHAYALGSLNFTGDMPVVLTHDGPSLGGFVCPVTIASTQLWKLGQASPMDAITFLALTLEEALTASLDLQHKESLLRKAATQAQADTSASSSLEKQATAFQPSLPQLPHTQALLHSMPASDTHPGAQYRLAGDRYVFVEYGPMELDLNLRVRIAELTKALEQQRLQGLIDMTPGVRSCLLEYDPHTLPLQQLLDTLLAADAKLQPASSMALPSRIIYLPLAFQEATTASAIQKYMKSVRPEAPYLPSNVDFIAANNGLKGADDVRQTVLEASYMVLGLGDVYLGAPCAVPVDPRHRLTVPKYNPARTFTPEGAVGIGGSYMCIYPMESPGGYQLVGRTLPIWNTFGRTPPFSRDQPWLLRYFDQVRFYEVSEEELKDLRKRFSQGNFHLRIEDSEFSMREHNAFLETVAGDVEAMGKRQKACMRKQMQLDEESLERVKAQEAKAKEEKAANGHAETANGHDKGVEVTAAFTANVWELQCKPGDKVASGQTLVVLEAMKMEYPIPSPVKGTVKACFVEGSQVTNQGDVLVVVEPEE